MIAAVAAPNFHEHMLAGLHNAALPCGVTDHGARAGRHIRHNGRWLAARPKHSFTDRRPDFILGYAGRASLDARLHTRFRRDGGLPHDSDFTGRFQNASFLNNAEAIDQTPIGKGTAHSVLLIGRKEIAVAFIANRAMRQAEISQAFDKALYSVAIVCIGTGFFHPGPRMHV